MKHITLLMILASFFSFGAYASAGETTTDCPMMMELNERTNPKANLSVKKERPKGNKTSGAVRQ